MDILAIGKEILVFAGLRVVGPYVVGIVATFILHYGIGTVLVFGSRDDDDLLEEWKKGYLQSMFKLKDLIFIWALGVIVFMLIGLV